jgi:NADH-quinone oxidoreductase subunit L
MGDVIDMRRFGGLRHRLPYTHATFAVGGLALAGIFPLAGFVSKDEILSALNSASHSGGGPGWGWAYVLIYWVAILTAFLTAFYTGRAYFMTFWGPERLPRPDDPEAPEPEPGSGHGDSEPHGHGQDETQSHNHVGHESPPIMTYPLVVLAACAALAGMVFGWTGWFEHHLAGTLGYASLGGGPHGFDWMTPVVSTIAGLSGLGLAYRLYAQPGPLPGQLATQLRPLYEASRNKFYVDEIYDWVVVKTTKALAVLCEFFDDYVLDRLVLGIARAPRRLAKDLLAGYQNGLIQFYAAVSALGVAVLLFVILVYDLLLVS